jgi:hypothetical protein
MSTLLADTIRKTGGTAGVDIRIKNTSVYESDGGTSVTQNVVQGLAKAWVKYDQDTPEVDDSFNQSSTEDTSTGNFKPSFSNSMGNTEYVVSIMAEAEVALTDRCDYQQKSSSTTGLVHCITAENGSVRDAGNSNTVIHGDLA